jgi:hypothetical protein
MGYARESPGIRMFAIGTGFPLPHVREHAADSFHPSLAIALTISTTGAGSHA